MRVNRNKENEARSGMGSEYDSAVADDRSTDDRTGLSIPDELAGAGRRHTVFCIVNQRKTTRVWGATVTAVEYVDQVHDCNVRFARRHHCGSTSILSALPARGSSAGAPLSAGSGGAGMKAAATTPSVRRRS